MVGNPHSYYLVESNARHVEELRSRCRKPRALGDGCHCCVVLPGVEDLQEGQLDVVRHEGVPAFVHL